MIPGAPVAVFLLLTFGISIAAGLAAFRIGGEGTFENPRALPPLLVTIWSPNIAAVTTAATVADDLPDLLGSLVSGAPVVVWVAALSPLAVAAVVALRTGSGFPTISPQVAVPLLAMNLVMGPLGEELGWRGFLLPRTVGLGLLAAALVVGVIWALWHLPLWWLPSPHREIPFRIFFATVVCFSIVMTALWSAADGALGPIVLYHLCANVGVGWLEVSDRTDAASAYRLGLPVHALAALVAAAWLVLEAPTPALG